MSIDIESIFIQNPFLKKYLQLGLVNISALADFALKSSTDKNNKKTTSSVGMALRRYARTLPPVKFYEHGLDEHDLKLTVRSSIQEVVFTQNPANLKLAYQLAQEIQANNAFLSLVQGEKEITLFTDFDGKDIFQGENMPENAVLNTDLGLISIDIPISLRQKVGGYSYITSILAEANIAIQSFHTTGGEVLILVKKHDLLKTHEVLQRALQ